MITGLTEYKEVRLFKMGLVKQFKQGIKALYSHYVKTKDSKHWREQIIKAGRKSLEPIPELTDLQKADIQNYWGQFDVEVPCMDWHRFFYARTGKQRPDFVPKTIFNHNIKPYLNELRFSSAWSDKSYLDYFIRGVNTPVNIVRNVNGILLDNEFNSITIDEAEKIISKFTSVVIKPTVFTNTGKGVQLLVPPYNFRELNTQYKRNFVIQLPIRQHEELAKLNASSVNTIRVNSLFLNGETYIMSCFIKVGQTGEFADNNGKDRFFIGVNVADGCFNDYAIDHDMVMYKSIPSGYLFAGKKIPNFDKLCQAVCKAHKQLAHFGLAFWDVTIREDGEPCIVEVNLTAPDSAIAQAACGPFFGEYTEQIMEYVVHKKN